MFSSLLVARMFLYAYKQSMESPCITLSCHVFDLFQDIEKKSIALVVPPLGALMIYQVAAIAAIVTLYTRREAFVRVLDRQAPAMTYVLCEE